MVGNSPTPSAPPMLPARPQPQDQAAQGLPAGLAGMDPHMIMQLLQLLQMLSGGGQAPMQPGMQPPGMQPPMMPPQGMPMHGAPMGPPQGGAMALPPGLMPHGL